MPGGLFRTWISWRWPPPANNLYDSERALRAAETIKAPELQLMAQTEAARALFHSRQYGRSAELLRSLVETTPAVLSIEFARAVALLLQALMPTNPGRDALNAVLDRARRRLSLAAAASVGDTAADTYQNAVQDELDVLQLFLESREGNWPSPGGELFHRLCPDGFCEAGHAGPDDAREPTPASCFWRWSPRDCPCGGSPLTPSRFPPGRSTRWNACRGAALIFTPRCSPSTPPT